MTEFAQAVVLLLELMLKSGPEAVTCTTGRTSPAETYISCKMLVGTREDRLIMVHTELPDKPVTPQRRSYRRASARSTK